MVAVVLLTEVNGFFLKYLLWIPPLNPLITYRLCLLFLMAVPAIREYYIFIETDQVSSFHTCSRVPAASARRRDHGAAVWGARVRMTGGRTLTG